MRNGRCRMHGGGSIGPRTPEGLERSRRARLTHGTYSQATVAARRTRRDLVARQVAQERADKRNEAATRQALARFFRR